eukprot:gene10706-biopygen9330
MVIGSASWAEHAYSQFGDVKYPVGFTHFDYVNPSAPKGGEIRLVPPIAVTNFDKFNPFTLKGTPPAGMLELVFESLLTGNLEEPSTGYGLLAEDVGVSPDGPYRPSGAQLGRDITYVRDKNYWGASLPVRKGLYNFDRITYKLYLDDTSRFEGLKAGEYDLKREFVYKNWARQYTGKAFDSGVVKKQVFEHRNPGDFQGYTFNLRNPKFKDIRVRKAIALTMDFEWLNRQMFYGLYKRVEGYFPNSDFHATLPPSSLRDNLRQAKQLLAEAGWVYRDGALRDTKGEAFEIEYLNSQPSSVRLVSPMQIALKKLGIDLKIRNVDGALYQQRMDEFEFELGSLRIPGRTSPGSDLFEYFGSKAATTPGSANMWGITDPAVDSLIRSVLSAKSKEDVSAAMRALDRVLSHGYYSIPQWY